MTPPRLLVPAALLVLALALGACGGDGEEASGAASGDGPTVVATTGFAADLVRGIAGDDAQVVQLVPDSANPHSYGASARDRAELDRADLVVAFGRSYEEGLPLDEVRAARFDIADHVGELRRFGDREVAGEHGHEGEKDGHGHEGEPDEHGHGGEEDGHGHEGEQGEPTGEEEGHGAGAPDPHVWTDPTRLAAAAPGIADALAQADPDRAAAYRDRAREQVERLRALDRELREILAAVPERQRRLVTSHESLGYFADRYGFALAGAPFGAAPEAQTSAQGVADVVRAVREEGVPVVFAQQGDDPKVMRRIAGEAGVEVVDDLLVENPGPGGETYADAMRHNARRIAEALGS
jgi:zinc/manganese transport system substrate-binding protein